MCLGKYKISLICLEFERIRGGKLIFFNFGPFSALSVQNRTKFGCRFVQPHLFYLALLSYAAEQSASRQHYFMQTYLRLLFLEVVNVKFNKRS